MEYTPKTFSLPELEGLSQEQIDVHLGLYQGYVKHVNLIRSKIKDLTERGEEAYVINELRRRFAFEFDGMRMHEYYFEQFEGGTTAPRSGTTLETLATEKYGSVDGLIKHATEVSGTRGIGWTVVYLDPKANTLHTTFVMDHELGQLAGLPIILAIDLWEHAYMVDYVPSQKNLYIEAFFKNLNWGVVESRLA